MVVPVKNLFALLAFFGAFALAAVPGAAQEPTVDRIEITPARVDVAIGDSASLSAVAYDAAGRAVAVPIQWLTSYEVGRIDSTGTFVGLAIGERVIIANAGGATATIPVVVRPRPPADVRLSLPATSGIHSSRNDLSESTSTLGVVAESATRVPSTNGMPT